MVRLNRSEVTLGQIEEDSDEQTGRLDLPPFGREGTTAHSFFDVFLETKRSASVWRINPTLRICFNILPVDHKSGWKSQLR